MGGLLRQVRGRGGGDPVARCGSMKAPFSVPGYQIRVSGMR
jgi:hypothetical protein